MIPELTRFYGGDPNHWLDAIPLALVNAHLVMMPRLRARESIMMSNCIAMGTGSLKKETARMMSSDWERRASGIPMKRIASPEILKGFGIKYVKKEK